MKTMRINHLNTVPRTALCVPRGLVLALLAVLAIVLALLLAPAARAASPETFTSSGTWNCPVGVTSVTVECWGGGGAGGSAQRTSGSGQCTGGGGAGGAYAKKVVSVSTGGNPYTVTVGAGGVILSSAANGTSVAGGDSWFSTAGTVIAKGGAGGVTTVGAGGTGGARGVGSTTGCIGDLYYAGGNGSTTTSGAVGGGGGGSGGTGSAGTSLGNNASTGATAVTGGGPGGNGATVNGGGSAPVSGPGGGGGGARGSATAAAGGAGFAGQVVLTYANAPTVTTLTPTAITDTTATLGANVTSDGGSALTSRGTVWDTTATPTANVLAEGGTTTGVFTHGRTGLPAGTQIFYRGYAINALGTSYSTDGSFYTLAAPATTASSAMNFTSVAETSMTVNWTSGDGGHRIVIAKAGSAPSGTPANATVYTADANYTSGQALAGGYVVYDGTGNSVTVSGLTASTTYYFVVYEYTEVGSTVATVNYLTSSSLSGSQASAAATTPTIIVLGDPVTLAYGSQGINSTSANQTYSVSGVNLTADISINAPSGYQISTSSGLGFGTSLTLTQASGTIASTTIYVRFAPTAVQSYSGNNVTNSSAGAPTINVAVTGTGAAIAPTVSSTAADSITGTTATLHGSIDFDGGATITDRGFVYGTATGITIASNKVSGSAAYSIPGTYAWVCPVGVTNVQVECWGGGGAGGSAQKGAFTGSACGGGGAGGAYVRSNAFPVSAGNTYFITVGTGGVSSTNDTVKVGGGDSWFNSVNSASSTLIAKGGGGGETVLLQSSANRFGAGGTVTAGSAGVDAVNSGGSGGTSTVAQTGGSGGGSGGASSAGNPGSATTGVGASAVAGGGNGGDANPALSGSVPGQKPTLPPGGGGGGARSSSSGLQIGGAGADGQVVLVYSGSTPLPLDYTVTGLSPNAVTYWKAYAINSAGTTLSAERNFYTLANVPSAPTLSASTTNTLNVRVNTDNPAITEFAIQETNSGSYVQANGTLAGTAVWQTTNTWHGATNFVTVTNLSPGSTYAFQVKARNNDSPKVETAFGPATVRATVPLAPTMGNDGPLCSGSTLTLTATTVSGATNYAWWGPNGFTNSTATAVNQTIPNVTTAEAGDYFVTAKREGQTSVAGTTTVTVNAPPTTSAISGSALVQAGQAGVTYSVTLTSGSSYAWTVPAGASITAGASGPDNNQITVTFGTTTGNVAVTETSAAGCTGSPVNFAVDVNHAPVAQAKSFSIAQGDAGSLTVIGGKSPPTDADPADTNLTVTAVGSVSPGAAGTASFTSSNVTFAAASDYNGSATFSYTVSDGRGGSDTKTVTVTITPASSGANLQAPVFNTPGVATLDGFGIPGHTYQLQYTENLNPVNWQDVSGAGATAAASASNGTLTLVDINAGGPSRYYRTRHIP